MAYHTIEDGPWPYGTTVVAYPTSAVVGGQPSGSPVASGVASRNGAVELGGLTEGSSYTAFGHGGSQEFEAVNQEDRIQALESGIYIDTPSWAGARAYRDGNKDGIFYIRAFADASGTDAPMTYTNVYGVRGTKTGQGSLNAFWTSFAHSGSGEAGLFIGDVTASAGGSAGNIWGGHFRLAADIAANMRGLHIELVPSVDVTGKSTIGLDVSNVDAFAANQGVRVRGNFTNPFIAYSNLAGTTPIFYVGNDGSVNAGGNVLPIVSASKDLGDTGHRWRVGHINTLGINNPDFAGGVGVIAIRNGAAPSTTPANGGVLYSESGALKWKGSSGTVTVLGVA